MKKITEEFLHFLWKNQSLAGVTLATDSESKIDVLDPGQHNHDSGPDFFNGKVQIDGTIWAGNIELHINASDWLKHGHQDDKSYDSVILHVVYFNDCVITRQNGQIIPVALIKFPSILWEKYNTLLHNDSWIQCQNNFREIPPVLEAQWISRLMIEKLSHKNKILHTYFEKATSHMDDVMNQLLFRCFGLSVNTIPFEMMASVIPYTRLLRTKGNQFQLEALLFGVSGMLHTVLPNDIYMQNLNREYTKYKSTFLEKQVPTQSWKFMRMRPSSFPTIRIAQLASLIHTTYPLTEKLLKTPSLKTLKNMFRVRAGDYWNTHYLFGKESKHSPKFIGQDFFHRIIINGIVPYMFFYGKVTMDQQYSDYAISLLEQVPAEKNEILEKWRKFGLKAHNGLESQGLLYLFKEYCKHKQCLDCQFGNYLILHGKEAS